MIPRLQIDISWPDLLRSLYWCARPTSNTIATRIEKLWHPQAVTCLSVRSGFDILLQALAFEPGSEIIVTAITIPDMVEIIKAHKLVAVPVDIDRATLAPRTDDIRAAINDRTVAVLIAHLFGGHVDMSETLRLAERHNLLVIEDAAQAYDGGSFRGHSLAITSMFSFGPIKTATALGGACLVVRDSKVRQRMIEIRDNLKPVRQSYFLNRILRYGLLKVLGTRWVLGLFASACNAVGTDYDKLIMHWSSARPSGDLLKRIRHKPCGAMLRLLHERIYYAGEVRCEIAARRRVGESVRQQLIPETMMVGSEQRSTHWLFPVIGKDSPTLVKQLRKNGFDATRGASVLRAVSPANGYKFPAEATTIIDQVVYVPVHLDFSPDDVERLVTVLNLSVGCSQ